MKKEHDDEALNSGGGREGGTRTYPRSCCCRGPRRSGATARQCPWRGTACTPPAGSSPPILTAQRQTHAQTDTRHTGWMTRETRELQHKTHERSAGYSSFVRSRRSATLTHQKRQDVSQVRRHCSLSASINLPSSLSCITDRGTGGACTSPWRHRWNTIKG